MWVFGYGSLVWRPAFDHLRSAPARIDGWARRFWQGSTDHRGVPGAPGRVVTLIRQGDAVCWGRVYEVDPAVRDAVVARLDHREQGGYDRFTLTADVVALDVPSVEALVYVARPDNPATSAPPQSRRSPTRSCAQLARAAPIPSTSFVSTRPWSKWAARTPTSTSSPTQSVSASSQQPKRGSAASSMQALVRTGRNIDPLDIEDDAYASGA